jgi:hypothetical protein
MKENVSKADGGKTNGEKADIRKAEVDNYVKSFKKIFFLTNF